MSRPTRLGGGRGGGGLPRDYLDLARQGAEERVGGRTSSRQRQDSSSQRRRGSSSRVRRWRRGRRRDSGTTACAARVGAGAQEWWCVRCSGRGRHLCTGRWPAQAGPVAGAGPPRRRGRANMIFFYKGEQDFGRQQGVRSLILGSTKLHRRVTLNRR